MNRLVIVCLLLLLMESCWTEYVGYLSSDRYYGYKRVGYNSRYGTPNYSIQLSGGKDAAALPSAYPEAGSARGFYSYTDIRH